MAEHALTNAQVTINSVDLSDHVVSCELTASRARLDDTAMGDSGRTYRAGLDESSFTVTFNMDFDAASVDATIAPLVGTSTAVQIRPLSGAVSATNPQYTFNCFIAEWGWGGRVGDLHQMTATWPVSGGVTRAVA